VVQLAELDDHLPGPSVLDRKAVADAPQLDPETRSDREDHGLDQLDPGVGRRLELEHHRDQPGLTFAGRDDGFDPHATLLALSGGEATGEWWS
jgi:hypothetical protein